MSKLVHLTCAFALGAMALSAQTATPTLPIVKTTGMVGLADAQTAQLNLLNPGVAAPATGVVCTVGVSFVDASGTVIKSATLAVPPGKSMSFIVRSDVDLHLLAGDRRELRATISIPAVPPPSTATSTAPAPSCDVIPTLEILDTVSGRSQVVLGRAKTIPVAVAAAQ